MIKTDLFNDLFEELTESGIADKYTITLDDAEPNCDYEKTDNKIFEDELLTATVSYDITITDNETNKTFEGELKFSYSLFYGDSDIEFHYEMVYAKPDPDSTREVGQLQIDKVIVNKDKIDVDCNITDNKDNNLYFNVIKFGRDNCLDKAKDELEKYINKHLLDEIKELYLEQARLEAEYGDWPDPED